MSGFPLQLLDATRSETIPDVVSFVGVDASGAFGIQPGHALFMTSLRFGLARFRCQDGPWRYLALPGGILRFENGQLIIGTRRYLLEDDLDKVSTALRERLLVEEQQLAGTRRSLRSMEEELLMRMWRLGRQFQGVRP
jgi:F-type H+-transporting ATPase subunit epsilon